MSVWFLGNSQKKNALYLGGSSLKYTIIEAVSLKSEIIMPFLELWILLLVGSKYTPVSKTTHMKGGKKSIFFFFCREVQVITNKELILSVQLAI